MKDNATRFYMKPEPDGEEYVPRILRYAKQINSERVQNVAGWAELAYARGDMLEVCRLLYHLGQLVMATHCEQQSGARLRKIKPILLHEENRLARRRETARADAARREAEVLKLAGMVPAHIKGKMRAYEWIAARTVGTEYECGSDKVGRILRGPKNGQH